MNINRQIFFMFPVLDNLENGKILRKAIAILYLVLGAFIVITGLIGLGVMMKEAFDSEIGTVIAAALFAFFFGLAFLYVIVQIFLYQANYVNTLPSSPFSASLIMASLIRLVAEVYASVNIFVGLFAFIVYLFAPTHRMGNPLYLFYDILPQWGFLRDIESPFLIGLALLLLQTIFALLILLLLYCIAEAISVLADIAVNIRRTSGFGGVQQQIQQNVQPAIQQKAPQNIPQNIHVPMPPASSGLQCKKCTTPYQAGDVFCENCGSKL